MTVFTITRLINNGFSTAGEIVDDAGKLICRTMERGPNNPDHPRIPAGLYPVTLRRIGDSKFDHRLTQFMGADYHGVPLLHDVPGRQNIEVHPANIFSELEGCIAPGLHIVLDPHHGYVIPPGASRPAFATLYHPLALAIDDGGAFLKIVDHDLDKGKT